MNMIYSILICYTVLICNISLCQSFSNLSTISKVIQSNKKLRHTDSKSKLSMSMNMFTEIMLKTTLQLSDTSISEEEVLDATGQVINLPDPLIAVGFGLFIFLGVAVLQFSLGDLTKEEGQARVRDFLQTRRDTERKRGYFD